MTFKISIATDADIAGLTAEKTQVALAERSEMLAKVYEEAGETLDPSKVKLVEFKDGVAMGQWVRNVNDELTKIGKRATEFDRAAKARDEAATWGIWAPPADAGDTPDRRKMKTFGDAFVDSDVVKAALAKQVIVADVKDFDAKAWLERKTAMTTAAGWAPQSIRTGRVVLDEQREIEVTDLLPVFPTTQAAVVFMEETTFTNAAAERAENAAYAEGALALTERSKTVRSVGVSLPVTDEQLADIDGRLTFMVRQKLDSQIIQGDGIAPNLEGTVNVSGIQTQAKGVDSEPDAIYKAIVKVKVTGRAQANVVGMHPNDWQGIRLLKTADGVHIWGAPMDAGPDRIWGLPVIASTVFTEGTAVVGDYARHSGLHVRQGLELQTGFVNDDFTKGRITLRAGLRVAVVHYRPNAFCTITGI